MGHGIRSFSVSVFALAWLTSGCGGFPGTFVGADDAGGDGGTDGVGDGGTDGVGAIFGPGAVGLADLGHEFPGEAEYALPPNFDRDEGRCPLPDARKLFGGLDFTLDDTGHPMPSQVLEELSARHRIPYEEGRFLVEFRIGEEPYGAIPGYDTLINGIQVSVVNVVENRVRAWVAVEDLLRLAEHAPVRSIAPPRRPRPSESEGVALIGADVLHDYDIAGDGIRIAVLDEGFEDWDVQQQDGQVPVPVYAETFRANQLVYTETDHGTAVAEIVRDVAPDVEIAIAAFDDFLGYMEAIEWAVDEAEADVILTTVGHVETEPLDGTGMLARTANDAAALGATVVSAAGNRGDRHYRNTFAPSQPLPWGRVHDFGGGFVDSLSILLNVSDATGIPQMVPAEADFCVDLVWEDWGPDPDNPNSSEDYDLYIFESDDLVHWNSLALSTNLQDGNGQPPTEQVCGEMPFEAYLAAMVVEVSTTQDQTFQLFSEFQNLDGLVRTPEYSLTTPCVGEDVICVGATSLADELQVYSGQGPTIPPTGFDKPELFAPDCVANETLGGPFCGTSASAPHVAGVAALYLQAYDGDAEAARNTLLDQALPAGPAGQYPRVQAACVDDDSDGYTICDGDCDDSDPTVHPGAADICGNGIDSDCNGNDGADWDEDGWDTCGSPSREADCDDTDASLNHDDEDVDGWTTCDGDCNDFGSEIHPGAQEICDGEDNDCDFVVPGDEIDDDGDGTAECGGDCDDSDPSVYPGAPEICDGKDNDCDDCRDERISNCAAPAATDPIGFFGGADFLGEHVVYVDDYGDIHLLSYLWNGNGWGHFHVSYYFNLPAVEGQVHGWGSVGTPSGDYGHLVFRDTAGEVHEVWYDAANANVGPNYGWNHHVLTQLTGAPAAASDPVGYTVSANTEDSEHVFYRDAAGDIHELWYFYGGSWNHTNLSHAAGATADATGEIDSWFTAFPGGFGHCQHTVYRATDDHIHEIWNCWYNGAPAWDGWFDHDLTEITGSPLAASDPTGFYSGTPGWEAEHVMYVGEDGSVKEMYIEYADLQWDWHDLGAQANAPVAGTGVDSWYSGTGGDEWEHVVYATPQGDVRELFYMFGGPGWSQQSLTTMNGNCPAAAGTPSGYYTDVPGEKAEHVVFRDASGVIYEMYFLYAQGGPWSCHPLT